LRELFDAHFKETLSQLQALPRIEQHIESFAHEVHKIGLAVEEIKAMNVELSPLMGEWHEFRRARPQAVRALNEADAHFLAGRRAEGARVLLDLVQQAGVGQETLCRVISARFVRCGDMRRAGKSLEKLQSLRGSPALTQVATSLVSLSTRGAVLPVWRSLPRGFVVGNKYRVEEEVGRGGMASVYRAVPVMKFDKRRCYALKVPAPELMGDDETRTRFEHEIEISQQLSARGHPDIVATVGYEVFVDPHCHRQMYALVLEFVQGATLAQFLGARAATQRWLSASEVVEVLRPVCEALECAHSLGVYHRDLKPHNVMLPESGGAKLMDFGIARVLDDRRESLRGSGEALGTPIYMAPEMWEKGGVVDARTDVYLAGLLLAELLTFKATGDPAESSRPAEYPVPAEWLSLFSAATSRSKRERPQTIRAFLDRLLEGVDERKQAERQRQAEQQERQRIAALHATGVSKLRDLIRPMLDRTQGKITKDDNAVLSVHCREHKITVEELRAVLAEVRKQWEAELPFAVPLRKPGDVVTNALGMKLAWVPAGTFWMGDPGNQKQVAVSADFYIGVHPVTQGQWLAVMGTNPSWFSRGGSGASSVQDISGADLLQFPVEQVSWEDAQEFLKRLNDRERNNGLLYRLPTEAEWEYSCRGAATSQTICSSDFYLDQPTNDLSSEQANFDGRSPAGNASEGEYLERTTKVGSYVPNRLGIYEMHGNVWEWTGDSEGSARVFRGGSWSDDGSRCRASNRDWRAPSIRSCYLGFRLAAVSLGVPVKQKKG
jgi:formylglycine-generating enzyme required for sulfatase activity